MTVPIPNAIPLANDRQHCIAESVHCHGTAHIFGVRAQVLRRRIKMMSFLGVVAPGLVGVTIGSFGVTADATVLCIALAGVASVPLFVLSVWSLVNDWPGQLSYADESHTANRSLAEAFQRLARDQGLNANDFKNEVRFLDQESSSRSSLDERRDVTENEKRMGMRAALRTLQMACAGCKQVPQSLAPTDCGVCGNFKQRRW